MAKPPNLVPGDKMDLYRLLLETRPDIQLKGARVRYTSLNGHMFTFISESGVLGIRLPRAEREAFLREHNTTLYEAHGTILKEYVTVPDELLKNTPQLKRYLDLSYEYVRTLKPKPQKRGVRGVGEDIGQASDETR